MKKINKLALRSETVAILSGRMLTAIRGGIITGNDTNNPTVTDEMGNCCGGTGGGQPTGHTCNMWCIDWPDPP